jgi:arylsulfatase
MRKLLLFVLTFALFSLQVDAVKTAKLIREHKMAVLIKDDIWIRDPYIIKGPDNYFYLTGTTHSSKQPFDIDAKYNVGLGNASLVGYEVQAWKSKDLVKWESLGVIYTLEDGVGPLIAPEKFKNTPKEKWRLWAPEFHFINGKFTIIHTTPNPIRSSNFSLAQGAEPKGPWSNPVGVNIGHRHDPSLFQDDDGTWWIVYGYHSTMIVPLKKDLTGFEEEPVEIGPTGEMNKMGHEGSLILKIHGKYVLFGTGWSTQTGRKGSYNLYYATADNIKGPYSERRFVGRFLGHGTPFQDNNGKWWCTAFFNANVPPLDVKNIRTRDLSDDAYTINKQGVTIVPIEIKRLHDGDISIRAIDENYRDPGPDEIQQFKK